MACMSALYRGRNRPKDAHMRAVETDPACLGCRCFGSVRGALQEDGRGATLAKSRGPFTRCEAPMDCNRSKQLRAYCMLQCKRQGGCGPIAAQSRNVPYLSKVVMSPSAVEAGRDRGGVAGRARSGGGQTRIVCSGVVIDALCAATAASPIAAEHRDRRYFLRRATAYRLISTVRCWASTKRA